MLRDLGWGNAVGGIDRTLLEAERDSLINLLRSKGRPLVFGMALLRAAASLGLFLAPPVRGFAEVAGGRFGGVT